METQAGKITFSFSIYRVSQDSIFGIPLFIPDVTAVQKGQPVQQVGKVSGGHYLKDATLFFGNIFPRSVNRYPSKHNTSNRTRIVTLQTT